MPTQPQVVKVRGFLKSYPWGKNDGLKDFMPNPVTGPQAELWFGNHPSGLSVDLKTQLPISPNPPAPILMKLLSIDKPLSIQVHPDEKFAIENYESLALSDKNGKDEMLIALEQVWAFAGIKDSLTRSKILTQLNISINEDFKIQCEEIFTLNEAEISTKITEYLNILNAPLEKIVFKMLSDYYPTDPGVLIASLLKFHVLEPGEALHVPPGCPHEYLKGLALEVMTNSDNVFRMGLTDKLIDKKNSLKVISPSLVTKFANNSLYEPVAPYEVRLIENQEVPLARSEYQVLLCLAGEVALDSDLGGETLKRGEAVLVSGLITGQIKVNGRAALASQKIDGRL